MDSTGDIPALPGPVIKAICSFLPISSRCEARLVSRSWRVHAGEAVNSISITARQLSKQVFADFTAQQAEQQLRHAAAAEALTAGATPAQAAAAAAAVQLSDHLQQPGASSSTGLRSRRGRQSAAGTTHGSSSSRGRPQHLARSRAARQQRQRRLNELHILALARRIAAAFPAATTALVALEIGEYGAAAAPEPEVAARKLLLLLSLLKQLARVRLSITAVADTSKQDSASQGDEQQQHQQQQQAPGQQAGVPANPNPLLGNLPPGLQQQQQQQQQPVAAAQLAMQMGVDMNNDEEDVLGFNPDDADYCYGWIARLLQHMQRLQQEQEGSQQHGSSHTDSSGAGSEYHIHSSKVPAPVKLKRQMLHPVLLLRESDLEQQQEQQQQRWSQEVTASGAVAGTGSSKVSESSEQQPPVPLVLEVCIQGAAYPRDACDWHQLMTVTSCATLLLPEHRPALLPGMVKDGLAGLTQLRALQLSVDAGYGSAATAQQWGVGVGEFAGTSSSSITALGQLTRLTHLALHTMGCSMPELTAAVVNLTALRELLISGDSMLFMPAVATALTNLEILVLQQQLSLFDLNLLHNNCPRLRYLETLGVIEAAGAAQNLLPYQVLLPRMPAVAHIAAAAAAGSTLLGPAADVARQRGPADSWLKVPLGLSRASPATRLHLFNLISSVAATFYSDADGPAGAAATGAAQRASFAGAGLSWDLASPAWPDDDDMWVCQLLAAQDELRQAVMNFAFNKLHMRDDTSIPHAALALQHMRDATPAVSSLTLLQLVAAAARGSEGEVAAAVGQQMPPGNLCVVREEDLPAGAVEDMFDDLLCGTPFGPPGDATEEMQQRDYAAEQAAVAAWRTEQHNRHRAQQPQQQQQEGLAAAAAGATSGVSDQAEGEIQADGVAPASTAAAAAANSDGSSDMQALLAKHIDWESHALQLQQWLHQRFSSGAGSTAVNPSSTAARAGSSSSLKRFVSWVGAGSDLSLVAEALPKLQQMELSVPPCLDSFRSRRGGPVRTVLLPDMQLWFGSSSSSVGIERSAAVSAVHKGKGKGDDGWASSSRNVGDVQAGAGTADAQQQQHLQQHLPDGPVSFSASFLAQQRQAILAHTDPSSSSSSSKPLRPQLPPPSRTCYFVHLTTLSISNLSRSDGPFDPSAALGDAVLAAAALGCPRLQSLELSGVLRVTGAGLLLLRRCKQLKTLRVEQWTNTATGLSSQQLPLAVCCLPPGLTNLTLINIHPITHTDPLAAVAAAVAAAGGVDGIRSAAEHEAAATQLRGEGLVNLEVAEAAAAAAAAVVAAAGGVVDSDIESAQQQQHSSQQQQQQQSDQQHPQPPKTQFLGLGMACRNTESYSERAPHTMAADIPHHSARMVVGSRDWITREAVALLLLDTFFGDSSSSKVIQKSLARLRCCCSCQVCSSHNSNCTAAADDSSCCLSNIFKDLEDLSIVCHGPGFEAGSKGAAAAAAAAAARDEHSSSGSSIAGGLYPFLAGGLPHAKALKHIHVSAPGAFDSMVPSEALLYGALTAANAATFYSLSGPLAAAAAAALQAGAADSDATVLQRCRRLLTAMSGGSSSSSGSSPVCGSVSGSYCWLKCLGTLPVLVDVHLDMPLIMPGQLSTLVSAVAGSSSITSLSLHGLALNLYSSHKDILHTMAQLAPPRAAAAAAAPLGEAGHPGEGDAAAAAQGSAAATAHPSSSSSSSKLLALDVSFTKHTVLPPVALSLSRSWTDVKNQRRAAADAQELALLQQIKQGIVAAVQQLAAEAAGGNNEFPPEGIQIAVPLGNGVNADNQPHINQMVQFLQNMAAAQQAAAADEAAAAAGGGEAQAAPPPQGGPAGLLLSMLTVLDHQMHMITHHRPAEAPYVMPHAAAASPGDKQLVKVLQKLFRSRGIKECSIRMHGSSSRDRAAAGGHGDAAAGGGGGWSAAAAAKGGKAAAAAAGWDSDSDDSDMHSSDEYDGDSHDGSDALGTAAAAAQDLGSSDINSMHPDAGSSSIRQLASSSSRMGAHSDLPELTLGFTERSGIAGFFEGLGSALMAMFSRFLHSLSALGPRLQHARFPGSGLAFRAWKVMRGVIVGGTLAVLAVVLAVASSCGWDDGLHGVVGRELQRLQQQQHGGTGGGDYVMSDESAADDESYDGDESSGWEDVEAGNHDDGMSHTSDDSSDHSSDRDSKIQQQADDTEESEEDSAYGDNSSEDASVDDGDVPGPAHAAEAAAAAAVADPLAEDHQPPLPPAAAAAAAAALANIPLAGLFGNHPAVQLGPDFVEQGLQELLDPDGELLAAEGVDLTGGATGVPPQCQVLGQLDSPASVGFMVGAVPVWLVGVWVWLRQVRWLVGWLWVLMRWLFRVIV